MREDISVEFSLPCLSRRDEGAGVFVGYIPALRIYSQGKDEVELEKALVSAAELFIVTCYERGILQQALQERGMTKAVAAHVKKIVVQENQAYIAILERNPSFEKSFTVKVPISILAAQQVEVAA
jgi:predicted RNase H-like HicB family nuclease